MTITEKSLRGKVAIVTGATKGIGKAIALGFAKAGADLVIISRHQAECNQVALEIQSLGQAALPLETDVTNLQSVEKTAREVIKQFGRIDILVNNAGRAITKNAEELSETDWNSVIDVCLKGAFFCAQQVGLQMIRQKSGKIINISSVLGLVGDRQVLPYMVAKGGLIQLTKGLALEWAKYNVHVNAICPGYIYTDLNRDVLNDEKIYKSIVNRTPLHRLADPQDLLGAVILLASAASDYITGSVLTVDGGWTAQ